MFRSTPAYLCFVLALILLSACSQTGEPAGPRYYAEPSTSKAQTLAVAVHPLYNPAKLMEVYQPLVTYLNRQLPGNRFVLEASRDYACYEEKIAARQPAVLLSNPWQTLQARDAGYSVIAMAGDPRDFKGLFLVRSESPIRQPADLKGKALSYPSPTALAACIMPQYFLYQQGIDVMTDVENRYVGSQESAIMNVYQGHTAVGVTWPPPWREFKKNHPQEAAQLRILWETPHLINNAVMVRNDVPKALHEQLRTALLQLHTTPEGRAMLVAMETSRFMAAGNQDYELVRRYIRDFERDVRPVSTQ